MKKHHKKIEQVSNEYQEILREGDELYQMLIKDDSKENHRKYTQVKNKERRKLIQLVKLYFKYIKESEVNYADFIREKLVNLEANEKAEIWVIISLLKQKKSDDDISKELCQLCEKILNQDRYDANDEYYLSNLIELLYLYENPIQIPVLRKIILKEDYYEFKTIGMAISFLKVFKSEDVSEILNEIKSTNQYKTNEVFRNNIDDEVPPEFWWTI